MDVGRTFTDGKFAFYPPQRFLDIIGCFESLGYQVKKNLQSQISFLTDVDVDIRRFRELLVEQGCFQSLHESILSWPLEDLNLLKSMLMSYQDIPPEQLTSEIDESIAKEIDGLFTVNDAEPSDEFVLQLETERFKKTITSWIQDLVKDKIPIYRKSKKSSSTSEVYPKDAQPKHIQCTEEMKGTSFLASQIWSREPFVGKVKIATRIVTGQGQKIRTFFPGNAGANMRMRKPFDMLKSRMLQNQRDHFKNKTSDVLEKMLNMAYSGVPLTCVDLSNFSAKFPRKILLTLINKILQLSKTIPLKTRIVTLFGPNNQVEEQDITDFLKKCFDCIMETEIIDLGKILNGTTLGIAGGWLLCTLCHILLLLSQEVDPFLIKGDDMISNSLSKIIRDVYANQTVSENKTTEENERRGTFLKFQLIIEKVVKSLKSIDDEVDTLDEDFSDGFDDDSFDLDAKIASKIPFPKPEFRDKTKLRGQLFSMIDAANNPGDLSKDALGFQRRFIFTLAGQFRKEPAFLPMVKVALENRIPFHSQGTQLWRLENIGDFPIRLPMRVDEENWTELNSALQQLLYTPFKSDCLCSQDEELVIQGMDGLLKVEPYIQEVLASNVLLSNEERNAEKRKTLEQVFERKWMQRGQRAIKVTQGDFLFQGRGVKKEQQTVKSDT